MMDARNELGGAVEFPFVVAGDLVACVEGMHRAIAERSFRAIGRHSEPVRVLHDGIATGVYRSLHSVARAAGHGATRAAALLPVEARDLSAHPAGARLVAALNGVAGDRLAAGGNGAAITMSVRVSDSDVATDHSHLAAAFPRASNRLAVFVHGLCGCEHSWDPRTGADSLNYGAQLEADLGHTPVFVRYNTGLHVSENGRSLSTLLEEMSAAWPTGVAEIVLIGHSMGGLVVRSACHYGRASGARWVEAARHVFCLGAPHLGAPLEKLANVYGSALAMFSETRPLAELVNRRSAGIKDLRFGSLVDEDWIGRDVDAFMKNTCSEVPFLDTAAYYFIGVTVTSDPDHPLGRLLGDLVVRFPSASGRGGVRRIPFEVGRVHHLGGLHHFDMLHRRAVYQQLRSRLAN